MNMLRTVGFSVVLSALALSCTGCLKRSERIVVFPDGRVSMTLEYEGKSDELKGPDAMPSKAGGWAISEKTKYNDKGEVDGVVLTAKQDFASRAELPSSFAPAGDENASVALQFPTTVKFETRGDETYVHFRRVYTPRPWSYIQYWEDKYLNDDIKKLSNKEVKELTDSERMQILKAFGAIESHKEAEWAVAALRKVEPSISQDHLLSARSALMATYDGVDWERLASIHRRTSEGGGKDNFMEDAAAIVHPEDETLKRVREEAANAEFQAEAEKVQAKAKGAFIESLAKSAKLDREKIDALERAFEMEKRRYEITGSVSGHAFGISVAMPGEIVAHNADKIDDDGAAVWEFSGEAFRDRPFELMVTSRMPKGTK